MDDDWTLQEKLDAVTRLLDQFGAEPGELPHERLIKLATKLASRIDMPWQYKLTCQYAETLENIVPTAPEGKGWELVSSSVLKRGSVGVGFRYEVFFTWSRK
jgi:hypothetical protein